MGRICADMRPYGGAGGETFYRYARQCVLYSAVHWMAIYFEATNLQAWCAHFRETASACRDLPVLTIWGEYDGAVRAAPEPLLAWLSHSAAVSELTVTVAWRGAGTGS